MAYGLKASSCHPLMFCDQVYSHYSDSDKDTDWFNKWYIITGYNDISATIKGNVSDVTYIDFQLQAKRGDKFLCFILFINSRNCSYLCNQMFSCDGV